MSTVHFASQTSLLSIPRTSVSPPLQSRLLPLSRQPLQVLLGPCMRRQLNKGYLTPVAMATSAPGGSMVLRPSPTMLWARGVLQRLCSVQCPRKRLHRRLTRAYASSSAPDPVPLDAVLHKMREARSQSWRGRLPYGEVSMACPRAGYLISRLTYVCVGAGAKALPAAVPVLSSLCYCCSHGVCSAAAFHPAATACDYFWGVLCNGCTTT